MLIIGFVRVSGDVVQTFSGILPTFIFRLGQQSIASVAKTNQCHLLFVKRLASAYFAAKQSHSWHARQKLGLLVEIHFKASEMNQSDIARVALKWPLIYGRMQCARIQSMMAFINGKSNKIESQRKCPSEGHLM